MMADLQRALTARQADSLFIVKRNGPITAADLAYHLNGTTSSARGVIRRLEARKLVEATHTGQFGTRAAACFITERGDRELAELGADASA